jgi:glutamate-1-semialdehyde 2,1-aminomutase
MTTGRCTTNVSARLENKAAHRCTGTAQPSSTRNHKKVDTLSLVYGFLKLAFWMCGYGLNYAVIRLFTAKDDVQDLRGRVLKKAMIRLGPFYIKLGQIIATRPDLFPPQITSILESLHDDVPQMKHNQMVKILTAAYGKRMSEINGTIFKEFDTQAFASASIAQVHKAFLNSGEKVAVKIVKHRVREQLHTNLAVIGILVGLLTPYISFFKKENMSARFEEIRELLINQADMKVELANQNQIYQNFRNHPYVKIPKVFPELSTGDILVMEFVDQIPGKQPHRVEIDRKTLGRRLQDCIYTMLFMHGFGHGDPHPGNFFYTKDGQVIPVDFGIVFELTEDEKWGIASFTYACIRQEWQLAVERFAKYFIDNQLEIEKQKEHFSERIRPIIEKHFNIISKNWSMVHFLTEVHDVLQEFNSRYSCNFQKVCLLYLSCEGLATMIDPDIDIWENGRKFTERFSPYMSEEVRENFDAYYGKTIPKSMEQRDRAKDILVAPTHLDRLAFPSTYPLFIESAKGCRMTDIDGNEYVDLSCGYGPHLLGYNHPYLQKATIEAVTNGNINALAHLPEIELARLINAALPSAEKVIFSNSGTEAVIHAIRLSRGYTKKDGIAKFEGHYHGFSDPGFVSSWFRFSGTKAEPEPCRGAGVSPGVADNMLILQYGDDRSLERIWQSKNELACVLLEPMPSGVAAYDIPFLQKLRDLCTELDIPLVFDEVVSGFRVAYEGVQGLTGVSPDLTCLGKIIGGGMPCGAVAGKKELIDAARTTQDPFVDVEEKVFVGGTMSGNYYACSTGTAMLTYLNDHRQIYETLHQNSQYLKTRFIETAKSYQIPFQMVANHSMFAMAFSNIPSKYYREKTSNTNIKANIALAYYMRKNGVYMPELHIMFLSAAHEQSDLDIICDAFDRSIEEMVRDQFFVY